MRDVLKKNKKKIYILACLLIAFAGWLACFYFKKLGKSYNYFENATLLLLGAMGLISALFSEDLSYFFTTLCYLPFVFARSLTNVGVPKCLYLSGGMMLFGFILHLFIYSNKFKWGSLLLGLILFGISLPLGGISNKDNPYLSLQIGMGILFAILILFLYFFGVSSRVKNDFTVLADIINGLALLICLQFSVYLFLYPDAFSDKWIEIGCVGWGDSPNNVAMLLLLCMPFSFYRFCYGERKFDFLYCGYFCLEMLIIVLTYSKGGSIFGALGFITMFFVSFFHLKKKCWKLFLPLGVLAAGGIVAIVKYPKILEEIPSYFASTFSWRTIESRFVIYKDYISSALDNPIFGKGLLYPFIAIVEEGETYQWGHNTFVHTFYCLGIVGLVGLLYHLFEKYYGVLRKIDGKKITLLFAFLFSGLYGLIDVSYFFINYMVVLLIIFILAEPYMEKVPYGKLFHQKKKEKE